VLIRVDPRGLIELRRDRGATVSSGVPAGQAAVIDLARRLVEAGRRLDPADDEMVALVRDTAARFGSGH
jgi:GntR family transcriptional regulator